MIIQHDNLLDLVLILIPYTYKFEFRTIVRCQVSFQSCKERERERKQSQGLNFTWKSPSYDCGKNCGRKYLGESSRVHLSPPPSSPVHPPAGSPLVAGSEKPEEAPGRTPGRTAGENWGGPGGAEVGNEPQDRGETETHPPTESASLGSPSSFKCSLNIVQFIPK